MATAQPTDHSNAGRDRRVAGSHVVASAELLERRLVKALELMAQKSKHSAAVASR